MGVVELHEVGLAIFSEQLVLVRVQAQVPALQLVDWVTWTSSGITHNFNNFGRLFSNSLKCLNRSCNKLALETHN